MRHRDHARAARSALAAGLLLAACAMAPPADPASSGTSRPAPTDAPRPAVVLDDWPVGGRLAEPAGDAPALPAGFRAETVFSGLRRPTALRIAPDGRVFVTEQRGTVLAFPNLDSDTPEVLLDLRTEVYDYWQMGLLGLALDPAFPDEPYLYLAYTHDAPIGSRAPTYGAAGGEDDSCPEPDVTSCITSGRVSRFRVPLNGPAGPEQVLVEDWCHTWRNHSIGTIAFAADGSLLAGGGDGADGARIDFGQLSHPPDACGRPANQPAATVGPLHAVGGSLRSQSLRTTPDRVRLNGTIIRVDRATGLGVPENPLAAHSDVNARRILAIGLRNPFRFTLRPGTDELWIADVGWDQYEELNVLDARATEVRNFGWPCFEGPVAQPAHEAAGHAACRELYADRASVDFPTFSFAHGSRRHDPSRQCVSGSSAISALAFYDGEALPARYRGALFFADLPRSCMWVIPAGRNALPDGDAIELFATDIAAVDLQVGPDGGLYYVDPLAGAVRRIVSDER
jgi:glucose/arabinose dehydrogenase